jgi:putative nucleotidyltransferase with HDIG domain
LSCAIAQKLKLDQDKIEGVRIAGLLHDIGKIHVPAEILSKPGRLNEFEFNIVKTHAQAGYDILKTIKFPWPVALIVLQHHERIDGSGYLSGLKGDDLLIESKIIAIADVIEAMVSHRPYRPALGLDKALEELSVNKGIKYDSAIVDACFDLFSKKDFDLKQIYFD